MSSWQEVEEGTSSNVGDVAEYQLEQIELATAALKGCDGSFFLLLEDPSVSGGYRMVSLIMARDADEDEMSRHGHRFFMQVADCARKALEDFGDHVRNSVSDGEDV